MKNLLLFSFFSFFVVSAFASEPVELEKKILQTSSHRLIYTEQSKSKSDLPTLIFLPGINRGLLSSKDAFAQNLIENHLSFVFMHFAEHPDSVAETSADEKPDFSKIDRELLADEVIEVVNQLGIDRAIPVTLSYSAVVTAHLDRQRFPVVIETAPIATQTDDLPEGLRSLYEMWDAWLKLNPFSRDWLMGVKKVQLNQHWAEQVDGNSDRLPILKSPEYRERAIQGYTALTLAAEDFDLRQQDFKKGPARYFILGAKESAYRAQIQKEAVAIYQKQTGAKDNLFVIPNAGHIVPVDQPDAYLDAVQKFLKQAL